jgi:hypothetical protein
MKSIQNQYRDLKEGKMSQANFMRNVRMSLPQYVTNVTSFNDTIKILKNKGILNESMGGTEVGSETQYDYEGKKLEIDPQSASNVGDTAKLYDEEQNEYTGEVTSVDPHSNMIHVDPNSIQADGHSAINEAKEKMPKGNSGKELYDEFPEGENLNFQEIVTGIAIEHQCFPDMPYNKITNLVYKNLKKDPNYYTNWKLSGVKGYEPEYMDNVNPEDYKMKFFNEKNLIDKPNVMKPVKGFKDAKADANKAKKETVKGEKIELMSLVPKTVRGVKKMEPTGEKEKVVKKNLNEAGGEYMFNGWFKDGEVAKLRHIVPDVEIEEEEEPDQTVKTVVSSKFYNEKFLQSAVDNVLHPPAPSKPQDSGVGVAQWLTKNSPAELEKKKLTKERLIQMVRDIMEESSGVYGGDNMTDDNDDTYFDNNAY